MNKTELIKAVAERTGAAQTETKRFLEAFTETLTETLSKGEKLTLVGFGTWDVQTVAARMGRNPRTGKSLKIEEKKKVRFKAGSELDSSVRKK
jgi:DNA-binding protein HU-beta